MTTASNIVDLIVQEDPSAGAALDAGMQATAGTILFDVLVEHLQRTGSKLVNESVSSFALATGNVTLTLTTPSGIGKLGMPVYLVDKNDTTRRGWGLVSTAESSTGVMTVNIEWTRNAGTATLWTVAFIYAAISGLSPVVAQADGGTGHATDSEAGISALMGDWALGRQFAVLGILSTPPGSPSTADRYLVGDAPTGDWSALENEVVEWTGSAWSQLTSGLGDSVIGPLVSTLPGNQIVFRAVTSGGLASLGAWTNSQWAYMTLAPSSKNPEAITANPISTSTLTPDASGGTYLVDRSGAAATITIPSVGANDGAKIPQGGFIRFLNIATGANDVTINVTGGGTINGATSYIIPNVVGATILRAVDVAGLDSLHWYVE